MKKRALSLVLTLVLCLGLAVPAFAAEAGDTTVTSDSGVFSFSQPILGTEYVKFTHNTSTEWAAAHEADPSLPYIGSGEIIKDAFVGYGVVEESADGFTAVLVSVGTVMTVPSSYDSGLLRDGNGDGISTGGVGVFQKVDFSVGLVSNDEWTRFTEDAQGTLTFAYSAFCPGDIYYISAGNEQMGEGRGIFVKLVEEKGAEPVGPAEPPAVTVENIPASGTAYASTQTVTVDGEAVEFEMYALKDENGSDTNYIKLRDLAYVLNDTPAKFSVGWDEATSTISVTSGESYKASGGEMTTPFEGNRAYSGGGQTVIVNGAGVELTAIVLNDDNGGGYTYFKLRDLGAVLGFDVGWTAGDGVTVATK